MPNIDLPQRPLGTRDWHFKNLVSKKRLDFGFGKLGLGKEKVNITRKKLDQVNSANLLFEL